MVSSSGLARDLLVTVLSGPHVLVLSEAILTEIQRVMTYPRVQERWPLSAEAIGLYASLLRETGALAEFASELSRRSDRSR